MKNTLSRIGITLFIFDFFARILSNKSVCLSTLSMRQTKHTLSETKAGSAFSTRLTCACVVFARRTPRLQPHLRVLFVSFFVTSQHVRSVEDCRTQEARKTPWSRTRSSGSSMVHHGPLGLLFTVEKQPFGVLLWGETVPLQSSMAAIGTPEQQPRTGLPC